jgi:hypothetical protein
VTVHRQTIAKIVTAPDDVAPSENAALADEDVLLTDEPAYGERQEPILPVEPTSDGRAAAPSKKAAE